MSGRRQTSVFALLSAQRVFPIPATFIPLTAGSVIPIHDTNTNNNDAKVLSLTVLLM